MPTSRSLSVALAVVAFLALAVPASALADHERAVDAMSADLAAIHGEIEAETRAVEDLLSSAASPGVQREIARKLERIRLLSRDAAVIARDLGQAARAPRRAGGTIGGVGASVVVVEGGGTDVVVATAPVVEPVPDVVVVAPPVDDGPAACSNADHARMLAAMDAEAFRDAKLRVLQDAARSRWFTVAQVVSFMDALTFSDDKVEAAALLHERVVDDENWFQVYRALTFDADKEALRARVRH